MPADFRDVDPAELRLPSSRSSGADPYKTDSLAEVIARLAEVHAQCPEMRFGQLLATIGMLAEDETGRSLWEVEDAEFAAALERFASDLARRAQ